MPSRGWSSLRIMGWILAAVCVVALTGVAAARVAHRASSTTLTTEKAKPGTVIVTSTRRALYLFTKDPSGRSTCAGACAKAWPPLIANGKVTVARGSGLKASLLGTTRRSDHRLQVTYDHHPLYMFGGDHRAGQINGEGASAFHGHWYLVSPAGGAVKPKKKSGGVCDPLCPGY